MPKPNLLRCCIPFNWRKDETLAEMNAKAVAKHRDIVDKQARDLEASRTCQLQRPRALTLPLLFSTVNLSRPTQITIWQCSSLFLAKLPLEVRRQIYAEVLSGKRFHMLVHPKDGRLAHVRCIVPNKGGDRRSNVKCTLSTNANHTGRCCNPTFPHGLKTLQLQSSDLPVDEYSLALLKTCRQVYAEAIDMLYSRNIFEFQDSESIFQLPRWMLPQRLNSIASVQVDLWYLKGLPFNQLCDRFPEEWEWCWRIIAGMRGLRELRVDIHLLLEPYKPHIPLKTILDPLKAVKRPKIFKVNIHGTIEKVTGIGDAPFDAVVINDRDY